MGAGHWGIFTDIFSSICGTFFLGIPDEQFNLGHWSYLFKMWTQEQLRDLTMKKVIEEHLALFQIKQHYERQNVDPPAELLADLELLNEEIKTRFGLIKIILNCITAGPYLRAKIIKSYVYFSVILWYPTPHKFLLHYLLY